MDIPIHILIGSIVGLVILSAFFSGSETSLTSASKPRMHNLAKSGKKNAKIFETLFKDKELLICTILFANNLVNVLASALATKILIEITNTDGIFYATVIMTLMILIFGELIPKTLALSKADNYALKISPFIRFLVILLYPLTFSLNFIVYILLKIVGVNYSNFKKEEISEKREEELRGAIDLHGEDSSRDEKNMLKSILDLDEITVGSIMISRKDIFSLPVKINYNDLLEKLEDSPHSRIPIWEKNPENIIGVLHVRRLISLKNIDSKKFDIKSLCQKPWFIPESTKLDNQLMEFKRRKEHFSIVVDEYGEFLGIVTLEDIIEEIVGDIDDEQDMLKISKKVKGIKSLSQLSFLVKGNVNIRDLNKELNINLPINNNVSTIAGLVLYESRTIPKTKQVFSFFDLKFEILNKINNQITLLKITKKKN
ncbi:MAG: CNNM domain-containing protein [Pseudomonadota bacterium]|nr:CNNM domain-containing protein [Pseudomonadota bacterium]